MNFPDRGLPEADQAPAAVPAQEPPAGDWADWETGSDLLWRVTDADPSSEARPAGGTGPLGRLFAALDPVSDAAITYFYGHLFAIEPQARAMFPPAMDAQRKRFYHALSRLVTDDNNSGQLAGYLAGLGRAHRKFGVQKEHFDALRQALAATWQRYAPAAWTEEAAAAWDQLFTD